MSGSTTDNKARIPLHILPNRQYAVLKALCTYDNPKEGAYELRLSYSTFKAYLAKIRDRTGVRSTVRLAYLMGRGEIVPGKSKKISVMEPL